MLATQRSNRRRGEGPLVCLFACFCRLMHAKRARLAFIGSIAKHVLWRVLGCDVTSTLSKETGGMCMRLGGLTGPFSHART